MSDNIIYIGSTDNPNKFHVGMTGEGRSPFLRWKDGDYRGKLSYVPKKVEFYSTNDLRDEPIHSYITKDKNIVRVKDVEDISSDEIFLVSNIDDSTTYIKNLVEEAIRFHNEGIRPIDKFFEARPHQEWVNSVILDRWNDEPMVQPLSACARFGKTLCLLDLFKRSELITMVIAGYWLSANESFRSTIEVCKYDITSDVVMIGPNYDDYVAALNKGQRVVIDVSLHSDPDNLDDRLLDALSEQRNLIVVDEADYGAWTKTSRSVLTKFTDIGTNLIVLMTGTNMERALIGVMSTCDNIQPPITVSYLNLIETKRGDGFLFDPLYCPKGSFETETLNNIRSNVVGWTDRLSDIVEVSCLSLSIADSVVSYLNDLSDEKRANMTKLFSARNSHIQHDILRQLFDMRGNGTDVFTIYRNNFGATVKPTVMMFVPGTKKDIDVLISVGKTILPEFEWLALHGDYYTNRDAEVATNELIRTTDKDGVIVISVGMGSRSYSVPNCCIVINAVDGGGFGQTVQKSSRAFTPSVDKKVGLVVNYGFSTHRTSAFESELIRAVLGTKSNDNEDTESSLRRVYGLVNFYRMDEYGEASHLDWSDFSKLVTSPDNLVNMALATTPIEQMLIDGLDDLLDGVNRYRTSNKEWVSAINKAKSYIKQDRDESESSDDGSKHVRDLIRRINIIINTTVNLHDMAPYETTFNGALTHVDSKNSAKEKYIELVGVEPIFVRDLIAPYLPMVFMDMIILNSKTSNNVQHHHNISVNTGFDLMFDF